MHLAGMPGFVEVLPDGCSLRWPDYVGNNMFQTLVRPAPVLYSPGVHWPVIAGEARLLYTTKQHPAAIVTVQPFCCRATWR